MGRHGWILHTLARTFDWIRFRVTGATRVVAALPARVPGRGDRDPGRAATEVERGRAAMATVVARIPPEQRLGADAGASTVVHHPGLPAEFPGAERFEEPAAVDASGETAAPAADLLIPAVTEDQTDDGHSGGGEEWDDSGADDKWSAADTFTFTPDPALDLVENIEFSFEPEPSLGESNHGGAATGSDAAPVSPGDDEPEPGSADLAAFAAEGGTDTGPGWIKGDGTRECPDGFPIKGNANSHIYHLPGQPSYAATIPELCFATEEAASAEGYRPTRRSQPAD